MAKFWQKVKNIFGSPGNNIKCIQRADMKWYKYQKISGGQWEECIPAIPYETCEACDPNQNCEPFVG